MALWVVMGDLADEIVGWMVGHGEEVDIDLCTWRRMAS
jgi:hypothetical protein